MARRDTPTTRRKRHAYVAEGASGDRTPIDLPIEDALPVLRDLARARREKTALYRASDGAKLAVAGAVASADIRDPGWRHLPRRPRRK